MIDDLVIWFPYSLVHKIDEGKLAEFRSANSVVAKAQEIASPIELGLPDILLEYETRSFVGVTFTLERDDMALAEALIEEYGTSNIRLVYPETIESRHYGEIDLPQLELFFDHVERKLTCEVAQLYEFYWYAKPQVWNMDSGNAPIGFHLSGVAATMKAYNLKMC